MGVALGRNPNGAVHDIAAGYKVLTLVPPVLVAVVAVIATASGLAVAGTISARNLVPAALAPPPVGPPAATLWSARREGGGAPGHALEWAGIAGPFDPALLKTAAGGLGIDDADALLPAGGRG